MKKELLEKLEEFAISQDQLDEVFENKSRLQFLNFMKVFQSLGQLP